MHAIHSHGKQPRLFLAAHILYWLQYCLNVVVYVLMNRQYREAYIELVAKVLPSWEQYKDFSFPWENPSISSKPVPACSGSFKANKDSCSQDPNAAPKEYKPRNVSFPHKSTPGSGRLSAIMEVNSSSFVSSDDVFANESQNDKMNLEAGIDGDPKKDPKGSQLPTFKQHIEEGTEEEKEHWLNQNGQTLNSPAEDRV